MPSPTARSRSAKRRPVRPEDLEHFIWISDAQISPDGRTVLFVARRAGEKNEYDTNLYRVSTAGRGAEPVRFTSGHRDRHARWSPRGDRIAFIGAREKTRPQIYTIPSAGGEATALTHLPEGAIGMFRWSPDGSLIAFTFREQDAQWTEAAKKERQDGGLSDPPRVLDHWWYRLDGDGYFNRQRFAIYVVNVASGEHRAVYAGDTLGFATFDFSPDSRQLVIATNRDKRAGMRAWNDDLLRLTLASGKITAVPGLPRGPKHGVTWSPDGRFLAWAGHEGVDDIYSTENVRLWVCDPRKGGARCLTAADDHCLMAAALSDSGDAVFQPIFQWSPDSRRVYAQIGWHGETHIASVKRTGGPLTFHTRGPRVHAKGNISADGRTMAMTVSEATKLDEVHVATLGPGPIATRALTDMNGPLLRKLQIASPAAHWVRAEDGTRVQVWVMRPPARGAKRGRRHPAVLEIHGGPHAQYGVGFFHEFQVLASAGYVVVYSNPRGSKGYGRDHCAAIRGSWGGADWVDMQAVIAFMQSRPEIDGRRMGVMGGSYGGYMTNWIIGQCRDFAAAITDRCVSNLLSMAGNSDFLDVPDLYWEGNAWDRPEARWESSPIRFMRKVRTPTLIIHSEGDLRCNVEQAEQMFTGLALNRVPTRFVRYPRSTSHGMSRIGPLDMRLHRLRQILEWWKEYL